MNPVRGKPMRTPRNITLAATYDQRCCMQHLWSDHCGSLKPYPTGMDHGPFHSSLPDHPPHGATTQRSDHCSGFRGRGETAPGRMNPERRHQSGSSPCLQTRGLTGCTDPTPRASAVRLRSVQQSRLSGVGGMSVALLDGLLSIGAECRSMPPR